MRKQISKIFIKWGLSTRQAAISEIISLFKETIGKPEKRVPEDLFEPFREAKVIRNEFRKALLAKIEE